jgi:glycerol transport system ATP-binding protein
LAAARTFSDPPLNVIAAAVDAQGNGAMLAGDLPVTLPPNVADLVRTQSPSFFIGIRAHQLRPEPRSTQDWSIAGHVTLAEIGGSDTYVHLAHNELSLVAQLSGVHELELGALCTLHVDPADMHVFTADGQPIDG